MFLLNSRIPLVRFSSESIVAGVRHLLNPAPPIQSCLATSLSKLGFH